MKDFLLSPGGVGGLLLGAVMCLATWAKKEEQVRSGLWADMQDVEVILPDNYPTLNVDSLEVAMAMFGIENPTNVLPLKVDETMYDRGLTSSVSFSNVTEVTIGYAAFENWSILGSTLAHEVEIHSQQNFFLIWAMDTLGLHGTLHAERVAYNHELNDAERFGLNSEDKTMIAETMNYYYPEKQLEPNPTSLAARMKKIFKSQETSSDKM